MRSAWSSEDWSVIDTWSNCKVLLFSCYRILNKIIFKPLTSPHNILILQIYAINSQVKSQLLDTVLHPAEKVCPKEVLCQLVGPTFVLPGTVRVTDTTSVSTSPVSNHSDWMVIKVLNFSFSRDHVVLRKSSLELHVRGEERRISHPPHVTLRRWRRKPRLRCEIEQSKFLFLKSSVFAVW